MIESMPGSKVMRIAVRSHLAVSLAVIAMVVLALGVTAGHRDSSFDASMDLGTIGLLWGAAWLVKRTREDGASREAAMTDHLRRTQESAHALMESMLEGLIVADGDCTIEYVNPAAARMFGYAPEELVGRSLGLLVPPRHAPRAYEYLRGARRTSMGRLTEWEGRRRGGEVFPFELSLFEYRTAAGRRFAGHVRDLTESRRLDRLQKEFVATVSHELRTPLTSIRGSLGLLAGGVLGELPPDAWDVVQVADRNTTRLIRLVNDILDLEKADAGRMEMAFEEVDAAAVVARAVETVQGAAEAAGVRVVVEPGRAQVYADAGRLGQVLVNLLSNAVKFSPAGGRVRIGCRVEDGMATLRVSDEGRGIPAELQDAIFERFQQVEASDSRQRGGTGLGLAISRAIVEQHLGTIRVESEMGRGSTFTVSLPALTGSEDVSRAAEVHAAAAFAGAASHPELMPLCA